MAIGAIVCESGRNPLPAWPTMNSRRRQETATPGIQAVTMGGGVSRSTDKELMAWPRIVNEYSRNSEVWKGVCRMWKMTYTIGQMNIVC